MYNAIEPLPGGPMGMQIIARLESIRGREHAATVALIEALVECDRTRAHVDAGYRSVFQLLVERLRYSPAAASRRFAAMRCARHGRFVIDMLRGHRTSLTALAKIAPVLGHVDDAGALLRSIDGLGADEVDAAVAALRPVVRPVERVRTLSVNPSASVSTSIPMWGSSAREPKATTVSPPAPTRAPKPEPRVALSLTLSRDDHVAFGRARARLGRTKAKPLTLEETLNALVAFHAKHAHTKKRPIRTASTERTRHIPRVTRDAVLGRDGHRCTFVGPDGTRCSATHDLQIDHVVPYAEGGGNTMANLRTMRGVHNRRLGEFV